jgi:tetratricopeptide (TPR) repeat protein
MDWYRRKTWTKSDEEEFFAKLGRARKDGRAQYLKIQAIELLETKDNKLIDVAETLLVRLLTDYPDNTFDRSSALHTLGNIYKFRENVDKAIDYYKQAIDFENVFPKVKTQAYLDFSELIVKYQKENLYDIAERIISDRITGLFFPLEKYKVFSILSIINNYKNRLDKSLEYAQLAELNANAETSGLRYHKLLGIVNERDSWLDYIVKMNKR